MVRERCHSKWTEVTSGVPQGPFLGRLIFLLYINNVPAVQCGLMIFANDTKLYSKVANASDKSRLLNDLECAGAEVEHLLNPIPGGL